MARHLSGTAWAFWRHNKARPPTGWGRIQQGYVLTTNENRIEVCLLRDDHWDHQEFTRDEARMLARRILGCLEGSK